MMKLMFPQLLGILVGLAMTLGSLFYLGSLNASSSGESNHLACAGACGQPSSLAIEPLR